MSAPASPPPVVRWAEESDLPAARRCYERNGYAGGIRAGDVVLVAEREGRVVGVVRLVEEGGHLVLRGMDLDEAERGRGLGGRMIRTLTERMGARPCWVVCGRHLGAFYAAAGFRPVPDADPPPHLRARAADYARRHGPQVAMRRPGRSPR